MKSPGRITALAVAMLAGVGMLSACSSGSSSSNDGKVTLVVASLIPGSDAAAFEAFSTRVKQFEKKYPNITVRSNEYQWTASNFTAELAGGTLPDVFNVPFTDSKALLQAGQLANITEQVKALPYGDKFNPKVLTVAQDDKGDIYGLPYGPYAMGLSYNRALFTQAGLDPDKPPTTWDEVRADAKIISQKIPGVAGYMQMTTDATGGWVLTTASYARGGRLEAVKDGKYTVTADNSATKDALQYLHDLRWNDNSMGSNFLFGWSDINQAFGAGQVAMYPSGSDVLTSLVQSDNVNPKDYGITTLPLIGKDAGALSGGNVAVVNPKASKATQDAAVKWIDFYYISKLIDKTQAQADAKVLAKSNQPVGVPTLPLFDQATYDQNQEWIKDDVNIPLSNVKPFTSKIFDTNIVPEPARHTQDLYKALDTVVQAVLTDKNADIDALLKGVNKQVQALIDADAK